MGELPDLGEALRAIVESVPIRSRPGFVALLERGAADRYRGWAADCADSALAAGLRACAEREQEIAATVEQLFPGRPAGGSELGPSLSSASDTARRIFEGRSRIEQLAIQARAERSGAAFWRALAAEQGDEKAKSVFLRCAGLEEESAAFLDDTVRRLHW